MKKTFLLVISMLIAAVAFGQNEKAEETEVIPPQFRYKDSKSINDFIRKNIVFPMNPTDPTQQGTVVVEFTVNPDSKISDLKFLNGISPQVNSEVLRVLQASNGKWNPGYVNKVVTPLKYEIAVVFYMNSMEELTEKVQRLQKKATEWMHEKANPVKALKYYNQAIALLPFEESLWADRAVCKNMLGDDEGKQADLEMFNILVERHSTSVTEQLAIKTGE